MESDYSLKRGDTEPPIQAQLTSRDQASPDPKARRPIDLSSALGVKLLLENRSQTMRFGGACTITNAPEGLVQWTIDPAFTALADVYSAEFEITWGDGGVQTVPDNGYSIVEVEKDLG